MTIEKEIANFLLQFHNIKDHKHGNSRHLNLTFGQEKGIGKKNENNSTVPNRIDFVNTTENLESIIKNKFLTISDIEQALKLSRCSFRNFFCKISQPYEANKRYLCELKRDLAVFPLKNKKRVLKRAKNEFILNLNIM